MLYYMKKLFFILTFCIFLGLGNFVSVAAETDVCATLKAEPEIEFTTSYGKLKYDFGYNQQGLTRLGQQYGIVEQGLFASGLAVVGVNWEVSLNTIRANRAAATKKPLKRTDLTVRFAGAAHGRGSPR